MSSYVLKNNNQNYFFDNVSRKNINKRNIIESYDNIIGEENIVSEENNTLQNLIVQKFTKSGTSEWISPVNADVNYILVGGGGGGGSVVNEGAAGGGGGGMVVQGSFKALAGNKYIINVGAGGNGASIYEITSKSGKATIFQGYSSRDPGKNGQDTTLTLSDKSVIKALGGSGGISTGKNNDSIFNENKKSSSEGGLKASKNRSTGGVNGNKVGGGGGGGASGDGETTKTNTGGKGGIGVNIILNNVTSTYGSGGAGGTLKKYVSKPTSGKNNSGAGGAGGSATNSNSNPEYKTQFVLSEGGTGGSGIVILSYYDTPVNTSTSTTIPVEEEINNLNKYNLMQNMNSSSSSNDNLNRIMNTNPINCSNQCENVQSCVGFVYNQNDKNCLLKRNILNTYGETGSDMYISKNNQLINFTYIGGLDKSDSTIGSPINGISIDPINGKRVEDVAALCMNTPNCSGFVKDNENKIYTLKSDFANTTQSDINKREIRILNNVKSINYNMVPNMNRSGYDLGSDTNKSVEECLTKCDSMNGCDGVAYVPSSQTCNYKQNILSPVAENNTNFYTKKNINLSKFIFMSGKDKYGADIGTPISGKTIEEVATLCINTPNAVGFVRDPTNGTCYLKNDLNGLYNSNPNLREVYALSSVTTSNYDSNANYNMTLNMNRSGFDISSENGKNVEECLAKCDTMNNCVGISYIPSSQTCNYKKSVLGGSTDNNSNLYVKKSAVGTQYNYLQGKDRYGFDIGSPISAESPDEMAQKCNDNVRSGCIGFSKDIKNNQYYMKSSVTSLNNSTSRDMYVLNNQRSTNYDPTWNYSISQNTNRPNFDIKVESGKDIQECLPQCDNMPTCTGVVYNPTTQTCYYKENSLAGTPDNSSTLYVNKKRNLYKFYYASGKDRYGADIGNPITGKSIETVTGLCTSNPNCKGFVRDPSTGTCYLKSDLTGMYNADPKKREIYILGGVTTSDYDPTINYNGKENIDRSGYDIGSDSGWSVEGCLSKCDNMTNCAGVAYVPSTQSCYYKENTLNTYPQNDRTFYAKKNTPINNYSLIYGYDNPTNSVGFASGTNASITSCATQCNNMNNCIAYTWDANQKNCSFKSSLSSMSSNVPNKELYYKNNMVPSGYTYVPATERKDYDITNIRGNPNDCKNKCDSIPECKGFIYDESQGACWLKKDVINGRVANSTKALYVKK